MLAKANWLATVIGASLEDGTVVVAPINAGAKAGSIVWSASLASWSNTKLTYV